MNRGITLAAFNIVTHPHSPENYIEIFKKALSLKQAIKIHGDRHALLRTAWEDSEVLSKKAQPIFGEICTYIKLDADAWFHLIEAEPATEEEAGLIEIPGDLVPHLKRIHYVFYPEKHLFVYVTKDNSYGSISPRQMSNYLEKLLNDNRITEVASFDKVEVRMVQSQDTIDEMLSDMCIDKLTIRVDRPNDTGGDYEQQIEADMLEQQVERLEVYQKSDKTGMIKPNEETVNLMKVALTNGFVEASGTDMDDNKKELKTEFKPRKETYKFDPDEQSYTAFLLGKGRELMDKIYRS